MKFRLIQGGRIGVFFILAVFFFLISNSDAAVNVAGKWKTLNGTPITCTQNGAKFRCITPKGTVIRQPGGLYVEGEIKRISFSPISRRL